MKTFHRYRMIARPRQQSGAALVVGLILLMVITVLAISGMSTSTLELQMAGNTQFAAEAFHQAEGGIESALQRGTPAPLPTDLSTEPLQEAELAEPGKAQITYAYRVDHSVTSGVSNSSDGDAAGEGTSTAIKLYHFDVTSTGRSSRNAVSVHTMSYYRKGPASLPEL